MVKVNTVLGPIDPKNLGYTLMHEHLIITGAGIPENFPELLGENWMERIIQEVTAAKKAGIDTMVCPETLDLGRDVNTMVEASKRSGMNIVACTGWYLDKPRWLDPGGTYDHMPKQILGGTYRGLSADRTADLFIREIKVGIAGTNVKAGVFKVASDILGVLPGEEITLRAVARAHLQTKVPIMCHSYPAGRVGLRQIAILKEEGVNLNGVKIDHCLDTTDVEYLIELLKQGVWLGLERLPGMALSQPAHARTIKALMDAGYADRLLPSHDHAIAVTPIELMDLTPETKAQLTAGHGFLFFKKVLQPLLIEMGVSEKAINNLFTVNPRRFFEGG